MSPKFAPNLLSTDSLLEVSPGGKVAEWGAESNECWLNLLIKLLGDVGDTIEATLIPPEAGLLSDVVFRVFAMGEGVLSAVEDASVPGVVTAPLVDCVLLSIVMSVVDVRTRSQSPGLRLLA